MNFKNLGSPIDMHTHGSGACGLAWPLTSGSMHVERLPYTLYVYQVRCREQLKPFLLQPKLADSANANGDFYHRSTTPTVAFNWQDLTSY